MAGDMEQVSLVTRSCARAAMSGACRRDRGCCAKERSTISARSLKASLATPDRQPGPVVG